MKYDIKKLTLEQKMRLLMGKDCWRLFTADDTLPETFLSDGPNGLRMVDVATNVTKKATAMPSIALLSYSWDPALAYLDGATIADDCIDNDADVLLAPGVNIKRTPLCGRNFEYFSEDPYLAGTMAKAYIEGVQSKGIGTSLKHYCANNREYDRLLQTSEVDERTLREIYLPAFEIAVQAKPWTVMCSYNPINGVYASENRYLLNDVLRGEFGFDGVIVSDWGATHNQYRAIKASLDITMPYEERHYEKLMEAYEKGWITEAEIDERVTKVLELMEKRATQKKEVTTTKAQRHENALTIAKESMVLLKNEDNILPLKGGKIAVLGNENKTPALGGGGSAYVETDYKIEPLSELLKAELKNADVHTPPWTNCDTVSSVYFIKDAYKAAYDADVTVLCVGTNERNESEGFDRTTLRLSANQEDLILNAAKVNKNLVVVLYVGSAVDMTPWIDKVKAVLLAGYAGEAVQESVAALLTGKACPCGKLSETFPLSVMDTPSGEERGDGFCERYSEGVFVGYRWFDKKEKEVLYPFGHGLSYANFAYSDLKIDKLSETDYEVSYTVKNLSDKAAKEISQVYVKDVFAMVQRPEKELKGYSKDLILPGESKRVSVKLNARSFAYYCVSRKAWIVENGAFEIMVGASSRDIRLSQRIDICLPENEQTSLC